jgi:hypothetical protein
MTAIDAIRAAKAKEKQRPGSQERLEIARAALLAAGFHPDYPPMQIGKEVIPFELETRHFLMVGTTGAGKTQAILQQLSLARRRDEPVALVDHGGEMMQYFYREGIDINLNPMDERCVGWSPYNELRKRSDFLRVAKFIVREHGGNNQDWTQKGQQFLADVLRKTWALGPAFRKNEPLLYFTMTAEKHGADNPESLEWLLQGTPSARLFGKGNEKSLDIVLGIVAEAMEPLTYLRDGDFSITDYVRSFDKQGGSRRWLFLSYTDSNYAAISPLISMWMEFAVQAGLGLSKSATRRFYLVLDELGSLYRMKALNDALTKLRKYGGVVICGVQSTAQLEDVYGEKGAQAMLSCFGTVLMLRVSDDATADKLSRLLGDHKIERESNSNSTSQNEGWSVSNTRKMEIERLVLASNFTVLPDRAGYLRIAGMTRIARLFEPEQLIPVAALPIVAQAEITRDDMSLEWLDAQRAVGAN